MMTIDSLDILATKVAGFVGACISLKFINGTWPERIVMAIGGSFLSFYTSPLAASRTGLPEGLCGFLLGLFGMAICAKVWELIQTVPIAEFWKQILAFLAKKMG